MMRPGRTILLHIEARLRPLYSDRLMEGAARLSDHRVWKLLAVSGKELFLHLYGAAGNSRASRKWNEKRKKKAAAASLREKRSGSG
ncbi:hypothetical protein VN24_19700 [Paenibacillus beijingensis]|uniref:Uncharacterized protein n=1 Tax=Paenibacillus beijingensis TaxID=1126833 RepID=A0A0D5NN00_9BACL|nr:hypothetical protein VN24_19700 [Paenibacillus beijingensis]